MFGHFLPLIDLDKQEREQRPASQASGFATGFPLFSRLVQDRDQYPRGDGQLQEIGQWQTVSLPPYSVWPDPYTISPSLIDVRGSTDESEEDW